MEYALSNKKTYKDLLIRSREFSKAVIRLSKEIKVNIYNENILKQLLRSATSIGANYSEARETTTKKDFYHKISICIKESKETEYWLDLLAMESAIAGDIYALKQEAYEFVKMFAKMLDKNRKIDL